MLRFSWESLKWVIYTNQKKMKNNLKPPNNLVKISKFKNKYQVFRYINLVGSQQKAYQSFLLFLSIKPLKLQK
ncbi:hypothetical protein HPU229254_07235 [Helicobacter pullorum]|nr:hypothetical protein HPU229254_07235 [Helicobacter pullorum]